MKAIYRSICLVILFYSFSLLSYSQEKVNTREFFVEAESYFLFEEYSDALPLYQRILRTEKDNYNVMFKVGVCYLNDPYQKGRSIQYLQKASENINPKYKLNSYKEKFAPPEANYYLGLAYRINGNIPKALEYYKLFKASVDPEIFDVEVVELEIQACERAIPLMKNPVYLTKDNFGNTLNSRFSELNAVISGDGNSIIFNRVLQFYDAVFISTKGKDGKWSPPYNLTPDFAVDGNSYCTGISYAGDEIFVYRSDNFDGNIYSSKLLDGVWQKLEKLPPVINTKYWESHATLSPDGQHLYFTSNRKGGYGGLDIYKITRDSQGKWGVPENLGPVINTSLNENTPFLSSDGNKLFFSSVGHSSIGGYDIFVSSLTNSGDWNTPMNMGYPFNTPDDDLFFCPNGVDSYTGIQSLYDASSTLGLSDIYMLTVFNQVLPRKFNISGKVNTPLPEILEQQEVTVSLVSKETGRIVQQIQADELGAFSLEANQGDYQLLIDGEGIKPVSVPVILSLTQDDSSVEIPMITAQITEKQEDDFLLTTKKLPTLIVNAEDNIITDTVPVLIELTLEEGSTLSIDRMVDNEVVSKEEFLVKKEKFAYNFTPEPGKNTVIFTVFDEAGNTSIKEISVFYEPKIMEEPITEKIDEDSPTQFSEVAIITTGGLQQYVSSLESIEYSSNAELYEMLLANTSDNDYTEKDVHQLMSTILTQRSMDEFLREITRVEALNIISTNDSIVEKSGMPLSLVKNGKQLEGAQNESIDIGLIEVVPYSGDNASLAAYILSFLDYPVNVTSSFNSEDNPAIYSSLQDKVQPTDAAKAVELASTTVALEEYYNNLLLSVEPELVDVLKGIDFDSLNINNSIELVNYLLSVAEENSYTKAGIIEAIEKARTDQDNNILEFKEALAEAARGELKIRIQEIDLERDNISKLSDIVQVLLRDAQTSGYGRNEVYDLLVGMIGIEDINEFVDELLSVSDGKLDNVISKMNKAEFSLPIEVVQYLLSEAPYFDYSDSDINNILIKMLLEKGMDDWKITTEDAYSKELIKKRKLITTIVLIGVFVLVLTLLFWRRSKKKDSN